MEFLSTVSQFGTVPLLILLVVIFILILKNNKEENARQQAQIENLSAELRRSLASVNAEISSIKKDYAEKTYVQETVGGWRSEIRDMRQEIKSYNDRIDKLLMEGKK